MTERQLLRLGILATDGCMLSSVAAASDAVHVARKLEEIRDPGMPSGLSCTVFAADGVERVRTSTGLELAGLASATIDAFDVVLVPGLMHDHPRDLVERVTAMRAETDLLRTLRAHGVRVAAACSGTFLLAESGLLDGRRATTSWWLSAAFRKRYPAVNLEADAMLVDDGGLFTAGAGTATLDLTLRLIAQAVGDDLAQLAARMELFDTDRQSQAPYVAQALIERPRHSLAERAERFLKRELHREISIARLAEHCRTSERSLLRHFRQHYGTSPLAHIQRLRVERAKALLETTRLSFEEIVERCGYSDAASFRKLFKRATTLTPADYRERFRLRPH